jgi:hypothetical protein
MKARWMTVALLAAAVACESRDTGEDLETGSAQAAEEGMAVDTVVTQRTVQDTAVVTHDTTVRVDTQMTRGERGVGRPDTLQDTRKQNTTTQRAPAAAPAPAPSGTDTMITADTAIRRDTTVVPDTSAAPR